jgi:MoxR-like ATPase
VAMPALRHRILLNFEGEADEISTDAIVTEMLAEVATE